MRFLKAWPLVFRIHENLYVILHAREISLHVSLSKNILTPVYIYINNRIHSVTNPYYSPSLYVYKSQ